MRMKADKHFYALDLKKKKNMFPRLYFSVAEPAPPVDTPQQNCSTTVLNLNYPIFSFS